MAIVDLIMPKMGESIMEATILKWYKRVGDHIQQDETLIVPSTEDGTSLSTLSVAISSSVSSC